MSENIDEWSEPVSKDTLSEFTELCNSLLEKEARVKALEAEIKSIETTMKEDEEKLLAFMKDSNVTRLDSEYGHAVLDEIISIRQPETMEDKKAFFTYLTSQGIFFNMVNVNSRTLNSWAKKEIQAKEAEGKVNWVPPGLASPYREFKVKLKPKKG